jgi:hypothetical protein
VPNLDFYAADGDWPAVLHAVFDSNVFRVLEAHSRPGHDLCEFHSVREAVEAGGRHLMLFVTNAGPAPIARRIESTPGASDAGFRYTCEGWSLIQLHYGGFFGTHELRWSHTNHNTEKRSDRDLDRLVEGLDRGSGVLAAVDQLLDLQHRRLDRDLPLGRDRPALQGVAQLHVVNSPGSRLTTAYVDVADERT